MKFSEEEIKAFLDSKSIKGPLYRNRWGNTKEIMYDTIFTDNIPRVPVRILLYTGRQGAEAKKYSFIYSEFKEFIMSLRNGSLNKQILLSDVIKKLDKDIKTLTEYKEKFNSGSVLVDTQINYAEQLKKHFQTL